VKLILFLLSWTNVKAGENELFCVCMYVHGVLCGLYIVTNYKCSFCAHDILPYLHHLLMSVIILNN
jgi:hypothetical protein